MLRNKRKFMVIFLILILLFSSTFVFAENEISNDGTMPISTDQDNIEDSVEDIANTKNSQEDTYKKSDVYLTGDNITVDYIVDGNLFVCADTVTINSQIGGDAFILAKNLIINDEAYVFNNVFAISNSIEIKGIVYDVYALTENLTISGGYIYRDIKVSCNTLNINGTIGRNIFADCASINFNTDQDSKGIIYGNLNYTSDSEISIPENVVSGEVHYTQTSTLSKLTIADYIFNLGEFLTFVLIIWLICLWLAPKFLSNTNNYVGKNTLKIFGFGLLALIAIPICCFILILLQLTSGISLLLLALYILAIVISKSLFTITANNYICSKLKITKKSQIFGILIITGIIVYVLTQIPYIGGIVSFIITVLGLGILLSSIFLKNKFTKINEKSEKLS